MSLKIFTLKKKMSILNHNLVVEDKNVNKYHMFAIQYILVVFDNNKFL